MKTKIFLIITFLAAACTAADLVEIHIRSSQTPVAIIFDPNVRTGTWWWVYDNNKKCWKLETITANFPADGNVADTNAPEPPASVEPEPFVPPVWLKVLTDNWLVDDNNFVRYARFARQGE